MAYEILIRGVPHLVEYEDGYIAGGMGVGKRGIQMNRYKVVIERDMAYETVGFVSLKRRLKPVLNGTLNEEFVAGVSDALTTDDDVCAVTVY